jgi:hypothetical protein
VFWKGRAASDLFDQKVAYLIIKGAKAIEFEDNYLGPPVAVARNAVWARQ